VPLHGFRPPPELRVRTPPIPLFDKEREEAKPQEAFKKRCRIPPAGVIGVSPIFFKFPQVWGIKGVG